MSTFISTILREDGEIECVLMKGATFTRLVREIRAEFAELYTFEEDAALLIDEEGARRPINANASRLANHPIRGDAMIVSVSHLETLPYE